MLRSASDRSVCTRHDDRQDLQYCGHYESSNTEGALIAAMFAAHGYIVVAPNYAGYDTSSLSYHPFLNGEQQSKEHDDALTAARTALPQTIAAATTDRRPALHHRYSRAAMWPWRRIRRCKPPARP